MENKSYIQNTDIFYRSPYSMFEEALPFLNHSMQIPFALFLKVNEMKHLMSQPGKIETLSACSVNPTDYESMLFSMRKKATKAQAAKLDMMIQMIQAMKLFNTYQSVLSTTGKSPENDILSTLASSSGISPDMINLLMQTLKTSNSEPDQNQNM